MQHIIRHNRMSRNHLRRNGLYTCGINHFTQPRHRVSFYGSLPRQILTAASETAPVGQRGETATVRVLRKRMVLMAERLSIQREVNGAFHARRGKRLDPRSRRDDRRSK